MLKQFDAPQWGKNAGEQLLGSGVSGVTTTGRGSHNRRPRARFDFGKDVSYDETAKRRFHLRARRQLRELAGVLGLQSGDYDLRSNKAGIAVSGEVTLHADHLYVQVNQSVMGEDTGILYRRCQGRRDYGGHGGNNFAPLDLLNDPAELAGRIRRAGILPPAQTPVTTTVYQGGRIREGKKVAELFYSGTIKAVGIIHNVIPMRGKKPKKNIYVAYTDIDKEYFYDITKRAYLEALNRFAVPTLKDAKFAQTIPF